MTRFSDMDLADKAEYLYRKGIFKKVNAFVNTQLRRKKSRQALEYTLNQCYLKYLNGGFNGQSAWAYCQKIINVTSGNYYEMEQVKKAEEQKKALMDWVNKGNFSDLISGIG